MEASAGLYTLKLNHRPAVLPSIS